MVCMGRSWENERFLVYGEGTKRARRNKKGGDEDENEIMLWRFNTME